MQVLLFRRIKDWTEVTAARYTGTNFATMNNWTGDALSWADQGKGTATLHDPVKDTDRKVRMDDWIVREPDGRLLVVAPEKFSGEYLAVTG